MTDHETPGAVAAPAQGVTPHTPANHLIDTARGMHAVCFWIKPLRRLAGSPAPGGSDGACPKLHSRRVANGRKCSVRAPPAAEPLARHRLAAVAARCARQQFHRRRDHRKQVGAGQASAGEQACSRTWPVVPGDDGARAGSSLSHPRCQPRRYRAPRPACVARWDLPEATGEPVWPKHARGARNDHRMKQHERRHGAIHRDSSWWPVAGRSSASAICASCWTGTSATASRPASSQARAYAPHRRRDDWRPDLRVTSLRGSTSPCPC